jgi:DNA-directed RNA polymerase subunit K/omega
MIDRSQVPNAFEFVTIASARAQQLLKGCTPRVERASKPARTAVKEVSAGLVRSEAKEPSDKA